VEWAIHATVMAERVKEGDLPRIFGEQKDFSHFELGNGLWGGVEVPSPGMLEIYTRSKDPCAVMAVLMEICERVDRVGFKIARLSIEAIPLGKD